MGKCNYTGGITLFRIELMAACNGRRIARRRHPAGRDAFSLTGPI